MSDDIARYLSNRQEEIDSAAEYRAMAESEKDPRLSSIYANLARTEDKHASFWEARITQAGAPIPPRRVSLRSRILILLARRFGARAILPTIASKELAGQDFYTTQPEARGTSMHAQETWHAQVLKAALKSSSARGLEGEAVSRLESRHRTLGGNALRASVLGANDGLCSNLSLIMGVAGATTNTHGILLTGLAGLLAGSFSMALGEWVSVTSSRELAVRELSTEAEELELDPASEGQELQLIYEAKGMPPSEAKAFAERILSDKQIALSTLAREELGIDPSALGGSAWEAATYSFILFSAGAILPLLPLFFSRDPRAIWASLGAGAIGLFLIGAMISLFTGRPLLRSGLRQLVLGLLAAGATFVIGGLVGAALT